MFSAKKIHMQIVTQGLSPTQLKIAKTFTKTLYLGGLKSFKFVDGVSPKKLVIACYGKRNVSAYL